MKKEVWAEIPDCPGYYANSRGFIIGKQNKPLSPRSNNGYMWVAVRQQGRTKCLNLGRVIYQCFKGPIKKGYEIDHIDGDRTNNSIVNLRAVTHKENMANPVTRRRMSMPKKRCVTKYEHIR